jgi:hypothetical protein
MRRFRDHRKIPAYKIGLKVISGAVGAMRCATSGISEKHRHVQKRRREDDCTYRKASHSSLRTMSRQPNQAFAECDVKRKADD